MEELATTKFQELVVCICAELGHILEEGLWVPQDETLQKNVLNIPFNNRILRERLCLGL